MSDFGDITDDDIFDLSDPDPEAVVRLLWDDLHNRNKTKYRRFDNHSPKEKAVLVAAASQLLMRLRREGPWGLTG